MRRATVFPILLIAVSQAFSQGPDSQGPGDGGGGDPPSRVARLNLLQGPVSFQPGGADDWTNATLNYPLTVGDHIYADQGARAEMHIGPNAVRLNSQTNFGFLNLDDRTVQIRLTEGAIHVRVRDLLEADVWEVDTPNGAVTLLRAGDYRIDTDPNRNATMVTVVSGSAEVNSGGAGFSVNARQTAYFTGDGSGQPDVRSSNPTDEFDNFCYNRDRREDTFQSPRYVSREMVGYEDLDANGAWSQEAEYGPVWRPRVAAGWVPYHDGHWAWVDPWGWTWIDAAPWGFAPFHYGRWAYIRGGWGWCPGPRPVVYSRPVYAPALVAFVGGGGWSASLRLGGGGGVAWFPLGFNEPYVPAYHHSDRYVREVNVTNINVYRNTTIVNNNYRYVNQQVPGAIVAVPRQAFVGSQRIDRAAVAVPAGAFNGARVGGFTAAVAPERASFMRPATGNVPRPSQAVMGRQVVARSAPPPAPVAFAARQQALQRNEGRPLAPQQIQTIRQSYAAPAPQAAVRMARPSAPVAAPGVPAQQQSQPQPQMGRQQPQDRMSGRPPVTNPQQPDRMNSRPPAFNREPQNAQPIPQQREIQPQPQQQREIQPRQPRQPMPEREARPQPQTPPQPQPQQREVQPRQPMPEREARPQPQMPPQPQPQAQPQQREIQPRQPRQPQPEREVRPQTPAQPQPQPQAQPQREQRQAQPRTQPQERARPRPEPEKKEPEKKEPEKK